MVKISDKFGSMANISGSQDTFLNPIRPAVSESDIHNQSKSIPYEAGLTLSTSRVNLGGKIVVTWNNISTRSLKDSYWLGLYYQGNIYLCSFYLYLKYCELIMYQITIEQKYYLLKIHW